MSGKGHIALFVFTAQSECTQRAPIKYLAQTDEIYERKIKLNVKKTKQIVRWTLKFIALPLSRLCIKLVCS